MVTQVTYLHYIKVTTKVVAVEEITKVVINTSSTIPIHYIKLMYLHYVVTHYIYNFQLVNTKMVMSA